ncbi:MAG: TVP38/TMEM64 family protein [Maritimibacter sp.]|nr:TVP38/TMEM64 family protein [Maritimibacter sp.]
MSALHTNPYRLLPLVAIALAAVAGLIWLRPYLSFDALAAHRETLEAFVADNYALAVAAFVTVYVGIVALSLPGATVATLAGGFLFGLFPGVLYNAGAATLGAVLIFLAARMGLGERLAARIDASSGKVGRLKRGLDRDQWSVLFLMRLVPMVPFFVANLIPGLLAVPLHRYVVTTALGILPGAIVYTSVGAGLGEVFDDGRRPDLGVIFEPHVLLPLLGLCLLAALPILLRPFRKSPA